MRIGHGTDVHAFSTDPSRRLRLGGVVIPDAAGLAGHSDADVVLHALVDGLLGAAALGDIGSLFGTAEPRWAGADSRVFVDLTMSLLRDRAWAVSNVDCTIVAARPRLSPHVPAMRHAIAKLIDVGGEQVSVKATTTDGLGFTGRGEGIACLAVVLLHAASASQPSG